ncbi:hypothetical protein Poly30_08620 [Planctomycetes bacterium Poly30]|uniref:Uncharacterized protein n=1 Tax=Saltatorellus ferox TaxID=2528018 RepID=A0A518EMQ5_9BACT|nr:hypothetical protein Poly30_08620 [Planctomycetes bacterium Poly30]
MKNRTQSRSSDLPGTLPHLLQRVAGPALRSACGLAAAGLALSASAAAQYTSFTDTTSLGTDDIQITPNGRYAVTRSTAILTETDVFEMATGQMVLRVDSTLGPDCSSPTNASCSGPCNDAVEVTNSRAITLGQQVQLIDLSTTPPSQIAEIYCGIFPRDVSISSDERYAIVRGGSGPSGGTYVIDMANGNVLLYSASEPQAWQLQLGNDLSAASDFHGVTLSYDVFTDETDVLVVEFDPSSGGGPSVVLDTSLTTGLAGDPMDVAITPDGTHAVVRAEDEIGLYRLDGVNTTLVRRFSAFPGPIVPYATAAFDTVVASDRYWASFSLGDPNTAAGYINVQDIATGMTWFAFLDGTPRDLALTPSGNSLLVHTGRKIYRWDLTNLPVGPALDITTFLPFPATAAGLLAGLDSVVCTEDLAAVIAPNGTETRLRIYDLKASTTPTRIFGQAIPGIPIDVEITPDGTYAMAVTQEGYLVVDLRTLTSRLEVRRMDPNVGFPWADGAFMHPKHAVAGGIGDILWSNWLEGIDLVSREELSCRSFANSTGEVGDLFALGSTRVNENDLELHARFLPPNSAGLFFLSSGTGSQPLGGGKLCLGGTILRLPVVVASAEGSVSFPVDLTNLPPAGAGIVAGTTWYSQLAHRDLPAFGFFNYTNASALLFE